MIRTGVASTTIIIVAGAIGSVPETSAQVQTDHDGQRRRAARFTAAASHSASDSGEQTRRPAVAPDPARGTGHVLILCGHPGDEEHGKLFAETVQTLHGALTTRHGFQSENVRILFGRKTDVNDHSALPESVQGPATRDNIKAAARMLRETIRPADALWVIVLGHAHYDGRDSWLNLPGPDLHQDEFGALFDGLTADKQVFFITTPVSGFFIAPLSTKGRIVVTATGPDLEVNETLFPYALADLLADPPNEDEFDANEDGRLSVFDLYIGVTRDVHRRYVEEELIPTEHARLDDNGDGVGTELQIEYLLDEQNAPADRKSIPGIPAGADGHRAEQIELPIANSPTDGS